MRVAFNLHKIRSLGKKTTTTVIPQSIELSDKCRQTKCHFVFLAFIKTSSQKKFQSSQTTKIIPTKDKETHFSILQLLLFTSEAWVSSASDCRNYVPGVVLLVIIADCFKFKWLELKKKKTRGEILPLAYSSCFPRALPGRACLKNAIEWRQWCRVDET